MVSLSRIDAAIANVTNTTFAHQIRLTDSPFGVQQLESVLNFPARDGKSWTVSLRTQDTTGILFIILALTFALDHYLFNSRYLISIGGARSGTDGAGIVDRKGSLAEKGALDGKTTPNRSNDSDSVLKPETENESDSPAATGRSRWLDRFLWTLFMLFCYALFGGQKKKAGESRSKEEAVQSASPGTDAEGEVTPIAPSSRWGKIVQHPVSQRIGSSVTPFLLVLLMLLVFGFHLLFWPWVSALVILQEAVAYEHVHPSVEDFPWQSIVLKPTLHLVIWAVIVTTLLLKPNRKQGLLWKCLKWTYAVTSWLFWMTLYSHYLGAFVARRAGYSGISMVDVFSIMRPSLIAYLYSGIVCDVVILMRLIKCFWKNDSMMT